MLKQLIAILLIVILLMTGCNTKVLNEDGGSITDTDIIEIIDNTLIFMKKPTAAISFRSANQLYDYNYQLALDAETIYFNGDNFVLALSFDKAISYNSYFTYIQPLGSKELLINHSKDYKSIYFTFLNIRAGDKYSLKLKADIEDTNKNKLGEDLIMEFTATEAIRASYTIKEGERSLFYPEGSIPVYDGEYLLEEIIYLFSSIPKEIIIDFSAEVDKGKVEENLKINTFNEDDQYTLYWQDNKTLSIHIASLKNSVYEITSFSYEMPIINDLSFTTIYPSLLYSYSYIDGLLMEESKFNGYEYDINKNPSIEDYLLMTNKDGNYLFNLKEDKVDKISNDLGLPSNLGMRRWNNEVQWTESNTVLWLGRYPFGAYTYNFKTKTKDFLKLPEEILKDSFYIIEYALSPNSKLIAILQGTLKYDNNTAYGLITVFDLNGEVIYESEIIENIRSFWFSGVPIEINLKWLNDREIVYEKALNEDYGVAITNINDGTSVAVNLNSYNAIVKDGLIVEGYPSNRLFYNGELIRVPLENINDIYVEDKDNLLIIRGRNNNTILSRYSFLNGKEEILDEFPSSLLADNFSFIGPSHDLRKVYIGINQYYLYDRWR